MKKELIILQVDTGNMNKTEASEYLEKVRISIEQLNNKHADLIYAFLIIPSTVNVVYRGDMNADLKIEIKEGKVVKDGIVDEATLTNKSFLYCNDQKIGVISDESIKILYNKLSKEVK